ncbi:MAG: glycosyltransferase [Anaerolineae bacterium]|nr:glycosyltransferase [Anaerolineae bacterium]
MISLIATVLNEGESIHSLMRSILQQTRQPDEVVIVDGGSQDDTAAILQTYADRLPLRLLVRPGCNISQGRNAAIAAAQGEIIAVTDAGVVIDPHWLERITRPLLENPEVTFVGGFFTPDFDTAFGWAMSATVLPLVGEIDPATFLPTSRSTAFRRSAWEAVGGYPEWLDYCEDLIFDLRVKGWLERESRPTIAFVPDALVAFRPRGSLPAFWKQYTRYARGDGKADLWRKRHAARYLTYFVALPVILVLMLAVHPLMGLLALPGAAVYLRRPYDRLWKLRPADTSLPTILYAVILVAVIRVVGDVAKMVGYPVGWWWRLTHRPPNWR